MLSVSSDLNRQQFFGSSSNEVYLKWFKLHMIYTGFRSEDSLLHQDETNLYIDDYFCSSVEQAEIEAALESTFDLVVVEAHLAQFTTETVLTFPVLDVSLYESQMCVACRSHVLFKERPLAIALLSAASIGALERSGPLGFPTPHSRAYLDKAMLLYTPALPTSVLTCRALLVLALALKVVGKDGVAWKVVGHALRTAQCMGMHMPA